MNVEALIHEYIKSNHVMQLATVHGGQPWMCTVHYTVDDELNMYWMSMRSTRHSTELRANPHVSVAVLQDPNVKRCVHIEADAYELSGGEELEKAHQLYGAAFGQKDNRLDEAKSGDPKTRTYYVVKPRYYVLFDEVNFPSSPRQEWRKT